ncbi:cupin domain-containing protein [Gymnodinialimonas sp. 57CJ19]|uniref:cupin domain-containing protein n=1 Tax=Gymnodinialimonas sp. 57CJ19 TaxID=3138498 RepID=UPI0031344EEA
MEIKDISVEEMQARVARYRDLKASPQAFVDTRIPEYERDIYNVIGRGVTEDAGLAPSIVDSRYFGITYVGAEPGKGAALHAHETIEVFIPLTGRWAAVWGEDGDKEIEIEPFDVISFPPGIYRGFRNIGDAPAMLMAIIGSKETTGDGGRVEWAPSVLEASHATGLRVNETGDLEAK